MQAVAYLGGAIGFGSCCALLQSLALADCRRMSDSSLVALAKGCPRLRFLNLSGCEKVSPLWVWLRSLNRGVAFMQALGNFFTRSVLRTARHVRVL